MVFSALSLVAGLLATPVTVCYEYDLLGRLRAAKQTSGSSLEYHYDTQSNRTLLTQSTTATATCTSPTVPASFPGQGSGNPNQSPTAVNDTASVSANNSVTIDVLANDSDPDLDPLIVASVTTPTGGSASIASNQVSYTAPGSGGAYTFNYTASDGNGGTDTATVTVTVSDPLIAMPDIVAMLPNTTATIQVLANDTLPPGATPTLTVTQPSQGTATVVGTTVQYAASAIGGLYTFDYTVNDGLGGSATATVTVNVTGF